MAVTMRFPYHADDTKCQHGYNVEKATEAGCPGRVKVTRSYTNAEGVTRSYETDDDKVFTLYEGAVLDTRERNYHDDSDFYAVVWDGQAITSVEYDTTRFAGGGNAWVDATDEVKAQAREYLKKWAFRWLANETYVEAKKVEVGKRVTVVKGRKLAHGLEGVVLREWEQRSQYGTWSYGKRVLLRLDDGTTVWTGMQNVAVSDEEVWTYLPDWKSLQVRAERYGQQMAFHTPITAYSTLFVA